jgi:addiction module HigA family antidote
MPKIARDASHPGAWIKAHVIPKGMTVTEAAALVGVGRVALSNLLNGNAALSADMAARLEKAFNCPRKELLELQARHDAERADKRITPADAKAYVPPFLEISANQLEQWVTHNIRARSRISVLLRTLLHSTKRQRGYQWVVPFGSSARMKIRKRRLRRTSRRG